MFEKNLAVSDLLDEYAAVLGERHRILLDYYYNQDLSLSEIAAEIGISRQGVRDGIKKAEDELFFLEKGLHLSERARALRESAEHVLKNGTREAKQAALALLCAAGISIAEYEESEGVPNGNV